MPAPAVTLLEPDLAVLDAAIEGPAALSRMLGGCEVADDWTRFPGALEHTRDVLAADPTSARWGTRLFLLDDPPALVGWGGFKGTPRDGAVELGYAVAPSFERRGIATAAVRAMLREAFAAPEVRAVVADTLPEPGPSARVLERCGFTRAGQADDADVGTTWRFRLERSAA